MKINFFVLLVSSFCFVILLVDPGRAQFCFHPKPYPQCKTFAITEIGAYYRVSSLPIITETGYRDGSVTSHYSYQIERSLYVGSELGFMRNINEKYSIGVSHWFGSDEKAKLRAGLKIRLRRWFRNHLRLDIAPGILLWDTSKDFNTPGFTSSIDLKIEEWFGLSAVFEYMGSSDYGSFYQTGYSRQMNRTADMGFYVGCKVGSYPGLIVNSAAALMGIIMFGLILSWPGD